MSQVTGSTGSSSLLLLTRIVWPIPSFILVKKGNRQAYEVVPPNKAFDDSHGKNSNRYFHSYLNSIDDFGLHFCTLDYHHEC